MDTSSNILEASLNIDSYLNLDQNVHHDKLNSVLQDEAEDYDQFCTSKLESQILPQSQAGCRKSRSITLASQLSCMSQKKTGKEATAKYREKRKKYIDELQQQVRKLEEEIGGVDNEIKTVKDSILVKLQSQTKAVHSTENAEIFNELQSCLPKNQEDEALVDLDKLNLLLNTLKYRIGPSGRERQAKIEYNFKNIVNTLFPGLHRYFLVSATQQLDLFRTSQTSYMPWTQQLMNKMNLSKQQQETIRKQESKLRDMHQNTLKKIRTLHTIKRKMREEAMQVDGAQDQIRENMTAVQCAKWTTFCQKYKYRKDISLDLKFRPKGANSNIEDEMQELLQFKLGRKMVHTDVDAIISKRNNR